VAILSVRSSAAVYEWREIAVDGGLMAYGDSIFALYRRTGEYAGRILNGAKPEDLTIGVPAKIGLVINLKTAKAIGLKIPSAILDRADEVIE
jgi:putative ABC transport system substrate-binding protein